jgi:hypothetical protein
MSQAPERPGESPGTPVGGEGKSQDSDALRGGANCKPSPLGVMLVDIAGGKG